MASATIWVVYSEICPISRSQVFPEANVLLVSGLSGDSRDNYQLAEPLEAVSYQRGFSLRGRP